MATTIIGILLIIMAVFLVISVLMQSSKDHRLGASIAGGAETFFGKAKGKSIDALLNKLTTVIAIVFVVLVLVLYFLNPGTDFSAVSSGADLIVEDSSAADLVSDADLVSEVELTEGDVEAPVADAEVEAEAPVAEAEVEAEAPVAE